MCSSSRLERSEVRWAAGRWPRSGVLRPRRPANTVDLGLAVFKGLFSYQHLTVHLSDSPNFWEQDGGSQGTEGESGAKWQGQVEVTAGQAGGPGAGGVLRADIRRAWGHGTGKATRQARCGGAAGRRQLRLTAPSLGAGAAVCAQRDAPPTCPVSLRAPSVSGVSPLVRTGPRARPPRSARRQALGAQRNPENSPYRSLSAGLGCHLKPEATI